MLARATAWIKRRLLRRASLWSSAGSTAGKIRAAREQLQGVESNLVPSSFLRSPATIAVLGAPQQLGQPLGGTDRGPQLLRQAGLREMLSSIGWRVVDMGDVDMLRLDTCSEAEASSSSWPKHAAFVSAGSRRLFEAAKTAHAQGFLVLTLGGDHSIALGSVAAAVAFRPDTRLLWVDAHADVNTPDTSSSGNMHGMPLGYLLGLASKPKHIIDWLPAPLAPSQLA